MTFFEAMRKALMAGLGVQESVKELVDDLVRKGELNETQGAQLVREWTDKVGKTGESFAGYLNELITKAHEKMNIPTREEYETLTRKVQNLSSRVKKLEESTE